MRTVKQAYNRDDKIMQIALLLFGATMRIQCCPDKCHDIGV